MPEKNLFIIGEVVGVHGLRGKLKIRSFAESIETYQPGIHVKLEPSTDGNEAWYEILESSPRKKGLLLSLKGVEDIDQAECLKGKEILINRNDLPKLEENTYLWQDLIGLDVFDNKRGKLGKIDSIIETGANDVFVVKPHKGVTKDEVLVPAIKSVIKAVNVEGGTMEIDLPEGL